MKCTISIHSIYQEFPNHPQKTPAAFSLDLQFFPFSHSMKIIDLKSTHEHIEIFVYETKWRTMEQQQKKVFFCFYAQISSIESMHCTNTFARHKKRKFSLIFVAVQLAKSSNEKKN